MVKHAVDHELMAFGSMHELDNFWSLFIEMSLVIGLFIDFLLLVDQLAHVDPSGIDLLLHKLHQLLQIVL